MIKNKELENQVLFWEIVKHKAKTKHSKIV